MPEHYKPFNLEQAKAGAPYGRRDGGEATVLKWDCRDECWPLVGTFGPEDHPTCWRADGQAMAFSGDSRDLVMIPLGFIDGKPVFVGDELISTLTGQSVSVPPNWWDIQYLRWPKPAPQCPQTKMTEGDICSTYFNGGPVNGPQEEMSAFYRIANAAIARAIKDGDVVPADRLYKIASGVTTVYGETRDGTVKCVTVGGDEFVPSAMLEKVAQTILKHVQAHAADFMNAKLTDAKPWIDVAAIITSVREGK